MEKIIAPKGLEGVVVDTTRISNVNVALSQLFYRGEEVASMAENKNFYQVTYLLMHDRFASEKELNEFIAQEKQHRTLSEDCMNIIRSLKHAHPMDALRTLVSYVGAQDHKKSFDNSLASNLNKFLSLYAKIPLLIAHHYRIAKNLPVLPSNDNLDRNENFFQMCLGEIPAPEVVKAFDASMTLYAEHSFNASTFSARVITSTTSDLYSSVTGAIGALKGPLHGGANEQVMYMLQELMQSGQEAASWLKKELAAKRKIMGFGHRVYKNGDSRVPTMQKYFEKLVQSENDKNLLEKQVALANLMQAEKGILPNLDYPAGPAYHLMGFDVPVFTPIFVMSRIVGWSAHIIEQTANNRIIRPLSKYVGK